MDSKIVDMFVEDREDILGRIRDWLYGSNLNADEQSNRRTFSGLKRSEQWQALPLHSISLEPENVPSVGLLIRI